MILGGIMGFVKGKSKASLIAGVVSGILFGFCYYHSSTSPMEGLIGALVVSLLLIGVFIMRLVKTKKFMPAGMLLAINIIVTAIVATALFTAHGGTAQ
jgi:uncharacterized membrane protein (UPF0136 family)